MASTFSRKRTVLILPAVLLAVSLFEDLVKYKIGQHIRDIQVRTLVFVVLYGAAFAVAADWISPWVERVLASARRDERRISGKIGLAAFYLVTYGALYYAY